MKKKKQLLLYDVQFGAGPRSCAELRGSCRVKKGAVGSL